MIDADFCYEIKRLLMRMRREDLEENKKTIYNIVNNLDSVSKEDVRRFVLYYDLDFNNNVKLTYSQIAKIENCSYETARKSVIRLRYALMNIEGKDKNILLDLIKEMIEDINVESYYDKDFSNYFRNFLIKVRNGMLIKKNREKLYEIVINMEELTKKQKRRFILYYGLCSNSKPLTYADIGRMEKCTDYAIEESVSRATSKLEHIRGQKKQLLIEICAYKNNKE